MYDYYFILDFEATCSNDTKWINEIIEFPIVVLDSKSRTIIREYREYVRPTINPILTSFCTKLTGITQEIVDTADTFDKVFPRVVQWCTQFKLEHAYRSFIFVTCGDWDLLKMLPAQASYCNMKIPAYFKKWVNIKIPFREYQKDVLWGKSGGMGMKYMLDKLGLALIGRHHSGLDDARNIAAITVKLLENDIIVSETNTV